MTPGVRSDGSEADPSAAGAARSGAQAAPTLETTRCGPEGPSSPDRSEARPPTARWLDPSPPLRLRSASAPPLNAPPRGSPGPPPPYETGSPGSPLVFSASDRSSSAIASDDRIAAATRSWISGVVAVFSRYSRPQRWWWTSSGWITFS